MPSRKVTLYHESSGSLLRGSTITGTDQYVNIPGFTFHEPLSKYVLAGWRILADNYPHRGTGPLP